MIPIVASVIVFLSMLMCVHFLQLEAQTCQLSDLSGLKHVQVEASETAMLAAAQLQSQLDISRQQNGELRDGVRRLVGMLIKKPNIYSLCFSCQWRW